ncbi:MAG: FAD-binding oxidoreductase, partial [Candidatus Limnocylindria bacterium]
MGLIAADVFTVDGLSPRAVAAPTTAEEVAAAIREANEAGEAVVLWGGGTRMSIGDPPDRYDVALDLRGLRGVVAQEPADMTITVRAGTTLA